MDVFLKGEQSEASNDRHPLLMEGQAEHAIDIPRGNSSVSNEHNIRDSSRSNHDNRILPNSHIPDSQSSSSSSSSPTMLHSRNTTVSRRSDGYDRRRRSPLNSGLWVSIELFVYISQIIAAIIVLSLSRNEHPKAPLFEWVIGYTVGCFATLPHLYWRYINGNNQGTGEDSAHRRQESNQSSSNEQAPYASVSVIQIPEVESQSASGSSSNSQDSATVNPRLRAFVDHFKMGLDCFFAVWFVVGNVWIFGGHSSASESPNLYRLCIVFLTFSCIGYAMPFVLCATICCCLPCIISILGLREELTPQLRGASPELLGALPTYKFKSKGGGEANTEGGIVAFGTDKERVISPDDAICCICLAKYADGDDLRELSCGHFFHKVCVDKWLKINALCPLCKAEVSRTTGSGH